MSAGPATPAKPGTPLLAGRFLTPTSKTALLPVMPMSSAGSTATAADADAVFAGWGSSQHPPAPGSPASGHQTAPPAPPAPAAGGDSASPGQPGAVPTAMTGASTDSAGGQAADPGTRSLPPAASKTTAAATGSNPAAPSLPSARVSFSAQRPGSHGGAASSTGGGGATGAASSGGGTTSDAATDQSAQQVAAAFGLAPTVTDPTDPNAAGDLVQMASGLIAGLPSTFSANPVRYADGVVELSFDDLPGDNSGAPWGFTRSWTNGTNYANGFNGSGMVVTQLPHLRQDTGGTIDLVSNGTTLRYFDPNGMGGYTERYYGQDTLIHSGNTFQLIDTQGDGIIFDDFSMAWQTNQQGAFVSYTDPGGNTTSVTSFTTNGKPAEIQRLGHQRRQHHHRFLSLFVHCQRHQRRPDELRRLSPQDQRRVVEHRAAGGLHLLRRHHLLRQCRRPGAGRGRGR